MEEAYLTGLNNKMKHFAPLTDERHSVFAIEKWRSEIVRNHGNEHNEEFKVYYWEQIKKVDQLLYDIGHSLIKVNEMPGSRDGQ